jgi:hypothetical protein
LLPVLIIVPMKTSMCIWIKSVLSRIDTCQETPYKHHNVETGLARCLVPNLVLNGLNSHFWIW